MQHREGARRAAAPAPRDPHDVRRLRRADRAAAQGRARPHPRGPDAASTRAEAHPRLVSHTLTAARRRAAPPWHAGAHDAQPLAEQFGRRLSCGSYACDRREHSLKTLNLSNCHVNLRGTTAIANAIDANTTLTALDVSGNGFRQPSRAASNRSISFINACAKHPALTDLNLDYNGLDAGDVPAIGRLLDTGRIRMLSLRGNRLFGRTQKVGGLIAASSASIVTGGVQAFADAVAGDGTPLDAVVDIRNMLVTAMPTEETAYRTFCLQNKFDRWQELVSDAAARRGIRLIRGAEPVAGPSVLY